MKTTKLSIITSSLLVLAVVLLAAGCPGGAYSYENISASGTVIAKDKDSNGEITSVELVTETSGNFIIENSDKGKELISLVDKKIEVSGKYRKQTDLKFLTVESYKIVE